MDSSTRTFEHAVPLPSSAQEAGVIQLHHPGYPSDSLLFYLYGSDTATGGISKYIAHAACAVVANNRFDGWISRSRAPDHEALGDEYLEPGNYYFHVPHAEEGHISDSTPYKYPIVPTFREWSFPHCLASNLPMPWSHGTVLQTQSPLPHPDACRLSARAYPTERAHVIPTSEEAWFLKNNMGQYLGSGSDTMHGFLNVLSLRNDIHKIFDDSNIVLLPDPVPSAAEMSTNNTSTHHVVAYVMSSNPETIYDWHRRPLLPNLGTQRELSQHYLFARFAWSIFKLLARWFLRASETRVLIMRTESGILEVREASAAECQKLSKPRSMSPQKRALSSRSPTGAAGETQHYHADEFKFQHDSGYYDSSISGSGDSTDDDEPPRGRPRKRAYLLGGQVIHI